MSRDVVGGTCVGCGREWRYVGLKNGRCPGGCASVSAQRPPAAKALTARDPWAAYEPEAKAMREGKRLGALHAGNPWAAAAALNVNILDGDPATMTRNGNDGWSIRNPARPEGGPHLVCLSSDLRGPQQDRVLAHELGHIVLGPEASERDCDAFSSSFMQQRPETPLEMAVRIQREGQERERRLARHAALERR
jgi:hypothetical protein